MSADVKPALRRKRQRRVVENTEFDAFARRIVRDAPQGVGLDGMRPGQHARDDSASHHDRDLVAGHPRRANRKRHQRPHRRFNRIIKQLKRVACGFRNMDHYPTRIMAQSLSLDRDHRRHDEAATLKYQEPSTATDRDERTALGPFMIIEIR